MTESSWPGRGREVVPHPAFPPAPAVVSQRALGAAEPFLAVAGIGAWMYEPAQGELWWSRETRRIHGVADDYRPTRDTALAFYPQQAREAVAAALAAASAAGRPFDVEVPIDRADGRTAQVRVRGRVGEGGVSVQLLGTVEDITDRRETAARAAAELELRARTETLLRDVIAGIPAALSVYDADERLILVNDMYRDILPGNRSLMIRGERLADIIARKVEANHYQPEIGTDDPPERRQAWIEDYLARHRSPDYCRVFHLSNDRWVQASTALSASGNIVSIRTDISALKRAEAELRRIAEHDSLTGLANRAVLMRRLADRRPGEAGLFILFDVDFFKAVNDSLGHGAGDMLLRMVGRRLRRAIRTGDTAARLAGDEFALIVTGIATPAAAAAFMARLMARLRRPLRLGSTRYVPSLSVGVTQFGVGDGRSADELCANADAALYEAKRQGRGRHVCFDAGLAGQVVRCSRLADRLRLAIAGRQVLAALQPQQSLVDGGILGFEALARWHDDGEAVPPSEFVALAERIGMAQPLGTLVMDQALAGFARMLAAGLAPGRLAVNVTTAQLLAEDFVETVRRRLAAHAVPPDRLEIEVTEGVLLDRSIGRIGQALEALRSMGVRLAMDDFGTGYASLSHLTSFPVDCIKIDACFTRAIDNPGDRGLIARTIISLGRELGLDVIAEGVETPAQRDFLVRHGCTAIQGWLFARPMLPDAALDWLHRQGRERPARRFGILRGGRWPG